jgi:hypothetical protein
MDPQVKAEWKYRGWLEKQKSLKAGAAAGAAAVATVMCK